MSRLVIRPGDWPVAVAGLLCSAMVAVSAAQTFSLGEGTEAPTAPEEHAPSEPAIPYAPAPGRDDRTPIEFMDQVFNLGDPLLVKKLSGIGPVFWASSGRASGTLIAKDMVLTTAHVFVDKGSWIGGNTLLPIPPDPSRGSIYLAACGRSYVFTQIELGSETPRKSLGLDYAIARLKEPACPEAQVLKPRAISDDEVTVLLGKGPHLLSIGAYASVDLPRYAAHPLMTGKTARKDGMHAYHVFGVRCALAGSSDAGDHASGPTGLLETDGCDSVPGGSGGPLLLSRDGGKTYEIVGVTNSYRPNSEFNNFTRVFGAFAAHLRRALPDMPAAVAGRHLATMRSGARPAPGPHQANVADLPTLSLGAAL